MREGFCWGIWGAENMYEKGEGDVRCWATDMVHFDNWLGSRVYESLPKGEAMHEPQGNRKCELGPREHWQC